ncbi:hypothetical protein B0T25DRAFT_359144 [Lasiosphaeria hispida]|uniref:Uncharacterized protein n=1 Tax=Lasiosphaeria hispida TaxID=260671 RepID=A0AAJ0M973_9PEZI|nr:hypothetical protein B0T25DRAFT_359144 [Lasiosphaeria hispida]
MQKYRLLWFSRLGIAAIVFLSVACSELAGSHLPARRLSKQAATCCLLLVSCQVPEKKRGAVDHETRQQQRISAAQWAGKNETCLPALPCPACADVQRIRRHYPPCCRKPQGCAREMEACCCLAISPEGNWIVWCNPRSRTAADCRVVLDTTGYSMNMPQVWEIVCFMRGSCCFPRPGPAPALDSTGNGKLELEAVVFGARLSATGFRRHKAPIRATPCICSWVRLAGGRQSASPCAIVDRPFDHDGVP